MSKEVVPKRTNNPVDTVLDDYKGMRPDEARFISAYMASGDAGKAHEAVYPGVEDPVKKGKALLATKRIKQVIHKQCDDIVVRELGSKNAILAETVRIGTYDIRDLYDDDGKPKPMNEIPDSIARSITGIKQETDSYGNVVKQEFTFVNKTSAMNLLYKHMNLFQEENNKQASTTNINIGTVINGLDDDALRVLAEQGIMVDPSDPVKQRSFTDNDFGDIIDGTVTEYEKDE